jgi:hypothetical protein
VFDPALVLWSMAQARGDRSEGTGERQAMTARARDYLIGQQQPDGSWPEATRPSGSESYAQRISTTAWALVALLEAEGPK